MIANELLAQSKLWKIRSIESLAWADGQPWYVCTFKRQGWRKPPQLVLSAGLRQVGAGGLEDASSLQFPPAKTPARPSPEKHGLDATPLSPFLVCCIFGQHRLRSCDRRTLRVDRAAFHRCVKSATNGSLDQEDVLES